MEARDAKSRSGATNKAGGQSFRTLGETCKNVVSWSEMKGITGGASIPSQSNKGNVPSSKFGERLSRLFGGRPELLGAEKLKGSWEESQGSRIRGVVEKGRDRRLNPQPADRKDISSLYMTDYRTGETHAL